MSQDRAFHRLRRHLDIKGAAVLEIGGSFKLEAARPFVEAGAREVVVTGLDHIGEDIEDAAGIRVLKADGLRLSEIFPAGSFDVVYGLAVVEHIPSPDLFLEQVRRILKVGGYAYFDGVPLWSSDIGHHLWVCTWDSQTTKNYTFDKLQGAESSNPIPPWGHLLMDEPELNIYLQDKGIPPDDAEKIVNYIYHSGDPNRINAKEIARAYCQSGLIVREAFVYYAEPPPDIKAILDRRHGSDINFGIRGVEYTLQKI